MADLKRNLRDFNTHSAIFFFHTAGILGYRHLSFLKGHPNIEWSLMGDGNKIALKEIIMTLRRRNSIIFSMAVFCLILINAKEYGGCKYPEGSSRYLTSEDLEEKSVWELKIMRNEIFARYGYQFESEEMKSYFNKQKWYQPAFDDVTSRLSAIEKANLKLIKNYEDRLKTSKKTPKIGELIGKQNREIVFQTPWGTGKTELNHMIPQEASPEGPMSFAVDDLGSIFVLDQVNNRIQVFDNRGKHLKTIPLPSPTVSDLDLGPTGTIFLLDQWRAKAVLLIDDKGNVLKKVGLVGKGIYEVGEVFGVYSRKDGLWVAYRNYIVRVCDASGEEDKERPMLSGLLCRDGKHLLKARKIGDITATVIRSLVGQSSIDAYTLYFDIPILFINLLDMDSYGNIYLGVELLEESNEEGPPFGIEDSHEIVVILDSHVNEKHRIYMPVSTQAEEVKRSFRVTPDGTIYQLVVEEQGATIWRYRP